MEETQARLSFRTPLGRSDTLPAGHAGSGRTALTARTGRTGQPPSVLAQTAYYTRITGL